MKTLLSFLLVITLSNLTFAQTTAIPDANFEQAIINKGLDNVIDGQVLTANIDTVTILFVNSDSISDLTGIQDFTALTKLYCGGNQLTNLDVTQNTALTELYCGGNQLTNLDVTQNTALTHLECSSNQLTSLDVTQNTTLTHLYSYNNQLANLDITQNSALVFIRCENNQLTNLDVTQNTALISLYCNDNQLTNLDVTHNSALTLLHCYDNQLTNLDVTQNSVLDNFQCGNNQLTNLDVTQNTALKTLCCNNNQLTNLDVTQNFGILTLFCDHNQLTNLDVSLIFHLFQFKCSFNSLICLNVKNGDNHLFITSGIGVFNASNNPSLTCIEVDDSSWATTYLVNIDPASSFSTNCNNACSHVGIEENTLSNLSIFPNPTTGNITIDLGESKQDIKTILTNSLGQVILTQQFESTNIINIDIDSPKGIYFLQIETTEGETKALKILKE